MESNNWKMRFREKFVVVDIDSVEIYLSHIRSTTTPEDMESFIESERAAVRQETIREIREKVEEMNKGFLVNLKSSLIAMGYKNALVDILQLLDEQLLLEDPKVQEELKKMSDDFKVNPDGYESIDEQEGEK